MISAVRSRRLSLWQSVVEERHGIGSPQAQAATKIAVCHDRQGTLPLFDVSSMIGLQSLVLRLAWAKLEGDSATAAMLTDALRYSPESPTWNLCAAAYLLHLGQKPMYRAALDPVETIPDVCTVLFLADWACGTDRALQVLRAGLSHDPDIIIDLGDTYYSGTAFEQRTRFLEPLTPFIKRGGIVRRIPGNHDYYAGGSGFYWLLDQLGQKASYFSLVNQHWRFQGMDTGFNDANPLNVDSDITSLRDDESAWHAAKIDDRKIVLLSHHQPFSAFEKIGGNTFNAKLVTQFAGSSALWLWGHEHRFTVYEEHLGVSRGRCIGAGAIPNLVSDDWFHSLSPGMLKKNVPMLGNDSVSYNNLYVVMKLNGPDATVSYYEVPGTEGPIYSESI